MTKCDDTRIGKLTLMPNTFKTIGIKRLAMGVDGPGVTTLVAGHSCPLRCKYCLNPQGLDSDFSCNEYFVDELIDELMIDNLYFLATDGGVTFGGGEPLLQAKFIHEFALRKPEGWRIVLESSLSVPNELVQLVVDDIDTWIIDVKSMDEDTYELYTQKPPDNMLLNLSYLLDNVAQEKIIVKVPKIPEITSDDDVARDIEKLHDMGFENVYSMNYIIPNKGYNKE